jgi:hypothetical protein
MIDHGQDHYRVLDLPPSASDAEIKRRYRILMRSVHPDANVDDPEANRKAAAINRAFETLGHAQRRAEYDAGRASARRSNKIYAAWAAEPDWEDIVAANVPPRRPAHVHSIPPTIGPHEIEIPAPQLRGPARVRRRISVTNNCDCTLTGDVSTSEPWLWGPIGQFTAPPGQTIEFDVEILSRKVQFPGISRVLFVTNDWTGVVPVRIVGYEPKLRFVPPSAEMPYVRHGPRWAKYR